MKSIKYAIFHHPKVSCRRFGKSWLLIFGFCFLLLFSSCEKIGTDETYSFTTIKIKVVYADTTYVFTYNGDTVQASSDGYKSFQIARKDTVGILRAYRADKVEIDSTIHIQPAGTLTFIQLPGEKIKIYDANAAEDEPAPTDTTCTKVRFTYIAGYNTADSLRFIWMTSKKASMSLPGSTAENFDTVTVNKGKLSPYVELDTDKYKAAGSNTYFFYTRQTWGGSTWTGSAKTAMTNTTIAAATYKFATYQLQVTTGFQFLFGTKWKE